MFLQYPERESKNGMKKTLQYGQPGVTRIFNPTTGTYYLVRRRSDKPEKTIQGKLIRKRESNKDVQSSEDKED